MDKIVFNKDIPYFTNNENFRWYVCKELQRYIETKQTENLPKLIGFGCFIVKGKDIEDYVLIDNKQNIIGSYPYTLEGFGQMEAKINIIKISKHYDDYEKENKI
jgi:hypothetical protein